MKVTAIEDSMAPGISPFHDDGENFLLDRVEAALLARSMQPSVQTEAATNDTEESQSPQIDSEMARKHRRAAKRKRLSMASQADRGVDDKHQGNNSNKKQGKKRDSTTSLFSAAPTLEGNEESMRPLDAVITPAMSPSKSSTKKRKRSNATPIPRRDTPQSQQSFGKAINVGELVVAESHKKKKQKYEHHGQAEEVEASFIEVEPEPEVVGIGGQPKSTLSKTQQKKLRKRLRREANSRKKNKKKANQLSQDSHTDPHTILDFEATLGIKPPSSNIFEVAKANGEAVDCLGQAGKSSKNVFMIPKSLFEDTNMEGESRKMKELLNNRKIETTQDMTEDSVGNESDTSSHLSLSSGNQEEVDDRAVSISFQPSSVPRLVKDIPILPPIRRSESVVETQSTWPSQNMHLVNSKTSKVFSETPILPPKKSYTQVATRSIPSINQRPAKPRSPNLKSKKTDMDEVSSKLGHKRSGLTRSSALTDIRAAESAESASISSMDEPETFSQTISDLKASSQKMQTLFSPSPELEDDPSPKISRIHSASQSPSKSIASTSTTRHQSFNTHAREIIAAHDFTFSATSNDGNTISDDWETSAEYQGRIRSSDTNQDDGEIDENIAFSSVYIASNNNILRLSNTLFQKETLAPGAGWIIGRDESEGMGMVVSTGRGKGREDYDRIHLRICSVVEGKINVQLAGKKFLIGKGGVWRVRRGEECVVRNACGDVNTKKGKKRDAVVVCFGVE